MKEKHVLYKSNSDALYYETAELGLTILGGIRLEGLDRLRVTLKIEVINRKYGEFLNNADLASLAMRHNVDLYNDVQVEKLLRKTAERLEIGITPLTKTISALTNELEAYRLEEIEKSTQIKDCRKILKHQEIEEAENFLKAPNLLERTNELIGKSGVIGEEENRLLMYLIFTTRKRENPLHVISFGASGSGKTHLQEKVGSLIPEEDKIEITTLSDNAFYYFQRNELSHKLILIEDMDGALNSLYPIRELQSKKRITKTVTFKDSRGITKTINLTVEGPVSVSGCTTQESIYEDNANRSFLIYLDESETQDEKIMAYQRRASSGKIDHTEEHAIRELLKNTQRIIQPITVRNPYAELLQLPQSVFKPRRTNAHYLQFIEAITFYHQVQREKQYDSETGEAYINTTLEDIRAANRLIKNTLLRKSDGLNGTTRNYFERLKNWLQTQVMPAGAPRFTNMQARQALRENHSNQKRFMLQLQQEYLIKKVEGDQKKGFYYEVTSMEDYSKLQSSITNALDDIFLKLPKEVQSSEAVQSTNEPLKTKTIKPKA